MAKDKKEKKHKESMSRMDRVVFFGGIIGGSLALVSCVPWVPWRYARMDPAMGAYFMMERKYSLLTVTDKFGAHGTWGKLKKLMCGQTMLMNQPSLTSLGAGLLGNAVGTGGALLGCAAWTLCKQHSASRCNAYTSLSIMSSACFALLLIGGIMGLASAVCYKAEGRVKKEKLKTQAKLKTGMTCIGSAICCTTGTLAWQSTTASTFLSFKRTGYYPFPALFAGFYIACVACFCLCVVAAAATYRCIPEKKEDEEEYEGAEGEDFQQGGMGGNPYGGADTGYGPSGDMPGMMGPPDGQFGLPPPNQPMGQPMMGQGMPPGPGPPF